LLGLLHPKSIATATCLAAALSSGVATAQQPSPLAELNAPYQWNGASSTDKPGFSEELKRIPAAEPDDESYFSLPGVETDPPDARVASKAPIADLGAPLPPETEEFQLFPRELPPEINDDERYLASPQFGLNPEDLPEEQYIIPPHEDQPLGYMHGKVPYRPTDMVQGDIFPVADRWRIGFPTWDRYARGSLRNPYRQSVLKGDYPIYGTQDLFFQFTGVSDTFFESREVPTARPNGKIDQRVFQQTVFTTFDLFRNDNTFHPSEWFLSITPAFRFTEVRNNGANSTQVEDVAIQTGFIDLQLGVTSEWYDTSDMRIGRQAFLFDFAGFLFADANDAVIYSGTSEALRNQWNVALFNNVQKDASGFNTFDSRQQQVFMANYIRNDFVFPGFNVLAGFAYNNDTFQNHVDAYFLELAWNGRINRFDFTGAFIQALGHDDANPIAGQGVDINAQLVAMEVAYPCDWIRPKASVLYASGDNNPNDGNGNGFDGIFDNPAFAGGGFSYLQREAINIGGRQLSNGLSFYPNLRAKAASPSNFVNPGIFLANAGIDAVLTTRLQAQANFNYYQFINTATIGNVGKEIGVEGNFGLIYKPYIVDNVILTGGFSALDPGAGISDLSGDAGILYTAFTAATVVY